MTERDYKHYISLSSLLSIFITLLPSLKERGLEKIHLYSRGLREKGMKHAKGL